ncbi:hypothetical protein MVEN_02344200 [Mycena venus]|uniref:Uncharacterized protein n=1 Tax=Mycena venus TaxID=2733690 RepID=A0A8H6X4H9_9AGAR|nr:hypothetical protein MVEN_02344200 [Mycena venus]
MGKDTNVTAGRPRPLARPRPPGKPRDPVTQSTSPGPVRRERRPRGRDHDPETQDNNTPIDSPESGPAVPGGSLSSSTPASGDHFDPPRTAEEDPRNTNPPETESDLRAIGNIWLESSFQSLADSGNQADTDHISTFVIWPPKYPHQQFQSSGLDQQDLQTLKDEFSEGGTIISVHSPDDLILWLETNHQHPLLQSMRLRGVGGPIAAMLSAEEPSLVVFGSIRDSWVVHAAELLSDLANSAVMIRPLSDDPVPHWETGTLVAEGPVLSGNDQTGEVFPLNIDDKWTIIEQDNDGADVSDNEGSTTTDDIVTSELNNPSGVFRLRGGARGEPWIGPAHMVDIRLDVYPRDGVSYNVDLLTRIQFQTQSKYNDQKRRRPQIISNTEFSVVPREGAPVKSDRSYSTIGFLVEKQEITDCRWLECPDFTPPRQTVKTVDTKAKANASTIGGSFSPHSLGTFSHAITSTKTNATENQNDRINPKCRIESWAGKRLRRNATFFDSFEIAYEAGDDPNKKKDGAKYPMEVAFSVGINVVDLPEANESHLPDTSFLILNQTNLWIYRSDLKTKGQGILVLTVAHLPDIATMNELRVVEEQTVILVGNCLMNVQTDATPINNPVDVSLSIARTQEPKPGQTTQQLWNKLKHAVYSMFPQKTVPLKLEIETLPIHEFISRGWDARLNEWRKVLYPSLTRTFGRMAENSDDAVWQLDVGDHSKGETACFRK